MPERDTTRHDASNRPQTPEQAAAVLDAYLEEAEDDAIHIMMALEQLARAQGVDSAARAAGMSRDELFKALAPGREPSFQTILTIIHALGIRLRAEPVKP